ncbi:MAG: imidazolonepropionase [Rudaea sp.]
MVDLIIHSAAQVVTVAGSGPKRGPAQADLGIIRHGAVAVNGAKILAVGPSDEILRLAGPDTRQVSAEGGIVLPGFVDAHTHVVFAGDRANEFELRLTGASYVDIMKAGGGIMSTVRATRASSIEDIVEQSRARLERMLACGTTTAEVKTGYGLDTTSERKLLDAISRLSSVQPVDLIPTFIGAHAFPEEYRGREDEYVNLVVEEMLPALWNESRAAGWAQGESDFGSPFFCDVFCDEGAFTVEHSRRILSRAKELGYRLKIHADEFANLGGAALAAELGATSADHLMTTRRDEMAKMAQAGTVAVLLPGTTFGLGKFDFANGRAFVEEGVPVALGTDINPGTSWCESMPLMMAIATRYERLTPAEAIVAATLNAAYACGVGEKVGSLEKGKQADILIAGVPDYRHLAYRYGTNPIRAVFKRGQMVMNNSQQTEK